jgi:hypothetical protein
MNATGVEWGWTAGGRCEEAEDVPSIPTGLRGPLRASGPTPQRARRTYPRLGPCQRRHLPALDSAGRHAAQAGPRPGRSARQGERRTCEAVGMLRYPLRRLIARILLTTLALGLVIVALGWGRAHPPWYDPWRPKEQLNRNWIPSWEGRLLW